MTARTLRQRILDWDGKSASDIQTVYRDFYRKQDFVDSLVDMIGCKETEVGSTWLLKHHLEKKNAVTENQTTAIYRELHRLELWEAKLHMLQSMAFMPIPKTLKKPVEQFVRQHIADDNKFVRAWAYNGFYLLAKAFPHYQTEATELFDMALRDEPASVVARVRKLVQKGF